MWTRALSPFYFISVFTAVCGNERILIGENYLCGRGVILGKSTVVKSENS